MANTKATTFLNTWLFKRPIFFSLIYFCVSFVATFITAVISSLLAMNDAASVKTWAVIMVISLIITAYYVIIKKLPHEEISQPDFVAITNGSSLITLAVPALTLLVIGTNAEVLKHKLLYLYVTHTSMLYIVAVILLFLYFYITGVAISGLYAKYKRATSIGISKWKVILSWPFGFLLSWMPGYLIKGKNIKSNLTIKSKWFKQFNEYTLLSQKNTTFVFLFLLLASQIISSLSSLILTIVILLYYGLWNLKYKSDFPRVLNSYYAISSVMINVLFICFLLLTKMG